MKRKNIIIAIAVLQLLSLSSITKAQQVQQPDYMKALGLTGNVRDIGVFTDNVDTDIYDYCTFMFDNLGRLISYSESEMIEGAYTWTAYFDNDGLPTYVETEFTETILQSACHFPELSTELVALSTAYDLKTFLAAFQYCHRH